MTIRARSLAVALAIVVVCVGSAAAGEPAYVGAKKCRACHLKQYTTWEKTAMAMSFQVLKPGVKASEKKAAGLDPAADYTADPKCLPCHTTGYLKPGGFKSVEATPDLVGIQCESCHGPGSEYLAEDKMSLKNREYKRADLIAVGLVVPSAETCTSTCHNAKSPFFNAAEPFDFAKRKQQGTHEHVPLKFPH